MTTSHRYTALIPPNHLGSLGYDKFTIFKDQKLGQGSYGTVYKAVYDDLPCAAKVLHPTLVDGRTGGLVERFEQECQMLSRIKHPNIVLYLGLRTDPVCGLPVLLMELLDESLTRMLLQSQKPLPYYVEVSICHNISLALSYLHSHNIIHRDLSGNNVLITAKRIAKVTDFGMSCIIDHLECTKLTYCPGTEIYMPPEAFNDRPAYTKALDVFSFGVILIQLLTRLVPRPAPRTKEISQLQPKGRYQIIVPECERRKEHINLIQTHKHLLLEIALDCIRDDPRERPEASTLCRRLQELKQSPPFIESKEQKDSEHDRAHCVGDSHLAHNGETSKNTWLKELQEREGEISSLHQQLREQERLLRAYQLDMKEKQAVLNKFADEAQHLREVNQWLTTQLQLKEETQQNSSVLKSIKETCRLQVEEGNEVLRASKQEIAHLRETNWLIMEEKKRENYEKDALLTVKESQIISLNEKLQGSERCIADYQTTVHNLQEQLKLQQKQKCPPIVSKVQLKYQSTAPVSVHRGDAAVHNGVAYFMFRESVLTYNIYSRQWTTLAECPQANGGFTVISELPTMVGGEKSGQATSELVSFIDGLWIDTFPHMPTPRIYSSVITCYNHVIVAGGSSSLRLGMDILPVVEVMDISNYQSEHAWSIFTSLPHPLASASVVIHNGHIILLGGTDRIGKTLISLTCDVETFFKSNKPCTRNAKGAKAFGLKVKRALDPTSKRDHDSTPPLWTRLGDCRNYHATCVSIGGQLLAVGGCSTDGSYAMVDRYNTKTSTWEQIVSMGSARRLCYAVGLSDNELMVVGGLQKCKGGDNLPSDKVEILTMDNHLD